MTIKKNSIQLSYLLSPAAASKFPGPLEQCWKQHAGMCWERKSDKIRIPLSLVAVEACLDFIRSFIYYICISLFRQPGPLHLCLDSLLR